LPECRSANDLLIIQGVSGSANTSLNGIPAINLSSSTGQWFGIPRASYPGVLSTPYYAAGTNPLTPQIIMLLESLMQRATGIKTEDIDEIMVHGNVDQRTQWETLGIATTSGVATVFVQNQGGDGERTDILKKRMVQSVGGHKATWNIHALPGRLDLLCLKYWGRVVSKPCALFDIDGITVFPLYGTDGGVATAQAFYYVHGLQLFTSRARSGAYTDGLTKPTGF